MIERLDSDDTDNAVWIVRPTRSLTWPEAKRWLYLISAIPISSGILFLYYGIPLVLPFAGLEVLLLWAAFYYVAWTGEFREVIRVPPKSVVLEKGRRTPTWRHELDRAWVRVNLAEERGLHPSTLSLCSHGRSFRLGEFLTDGERQHLALALINALNKNR